MPKADLRSARTKLRWANDQIVILDAEIQILIEANRRSIPPDPRFSHMGTSVRATMQNNRPDIPDDMKHRIGMIATEQRHSLDHLVVALGRKNTGRDSSKAHFPFCDTAADLTGKKVTAKLKDLDPADRALILSEKPYPGGDDDLCLMNRLSNTSKHRDFVLVAADVSGMSISGNGYIRRLGIWPGLDPDTTHVFVDADPGVTVSNVITLAFIDPDMAAPKPVIETLKLFSAQCSRIIGQFE